MKIVLYGALSFRLLQIIYSSLVFNSLGGLDLFLKIWNTIKEGKQTNIFIFLNIFGVNGSSCYLN